MGKFLWRDRRCFINISSEPDALRMLLIRLLTCVNFTLDEIIHLTYCANRTKKLILMSYGSRISSWKSWRWTRFSLTFGVSDININSSLVPLSKIHNNIRSNHFKYILPWNISKIIIKTIPIKSCAMKRCILLWV